MPKRIDPRIEIGRVDLTVADLEGALAFYNGVLGFDVLGRTGDSAFLSADGRQRHIGLHTSSSDGSHSGSGPVRFSIRYPDRSSLGDALQRLRDANVPLEGAGDSGVGEAIYVRDPAGHVLELYWDRPRDAWTHVPDMSAQATAVPLDLHALPAAAGTAGVPADRPPSPYAPMSEKMRQSLRDLRGRLLQLHKALLDDARAAYELDRGRVDSSASLLQLVINDPWFAWLHSVSELVVRIDEAVELDSPATDADATALTGHVDRLLTASENGRGFQQRYYEALQRQPAVVLAHAEVKRVLKGLR